MISFDSPGASAGLGGMFRTSGYAAESNGLGNSNGSSGQYAPNPVVIPSGGGTRFQDAQDANTETVFGNENTYIYDSNSFDPYTTLFGDNVNYDATKGDPLAYLKARAAMPTSMGEWGIDKWINNTYESMKIPGYVASQASEDFINSLTTMGVHELQALGKKGHDYGTSFADDSFNDKYQPQGYARGGEVMNGLASGMPQSLPQQELGGVDPSQQGPSPEDQQLIQAAIAALDQESGMSEDDRVAILTEFENVFGEGAVEALLEEIQKGSETDTQPAMLTPGEYVLPKPIVDDVGAGRLDEMVRRETGQEPGGRPVQAQGLGGGLV